jgi:hypothetical protein
VRRHSEDIGLALEEAVTLVGFGMSCESARSDSFGVGMTCSSEAVSALGVGALEIRRLGPCRGWEMNSFAGDNKEVRSMCLEENWR